MYRKNKYQTGDGNRVAFEEAEFNSRPTQRVLPYISPVANMGDSNLLDIATAIYGSAQSFKPENYYQQGSKESYGKYKIKNNSDQDYYINPEEFAKNPAGSNVFMDKTQKTDYYTTKMLQDRSKSAPELFANVTGYNSVTNTPTYEGKMKPGDIFESSEPNADYLGFLKGNGMYIPNATGNINSNGQFQFNNAPRPLTEPAYIQPKNLKRGGGIDNPGFKALPIEVQNKIIKKQGGNVYTDTMSDFYSNTYADEAMQEFGGEYNIEEEDVFLTPIELEKMEKGGGIPERYQRKGFTKVGAKKDSNRPGKKWMVLAKKGDQYKIVHGGFVGMKDYTQHRSEKRQDRFWDRMGGRNSAKAKDPFSPLYWHKRFGTWAEGGEPLLEYQTLGSWPPVGFDINNPMGLPNFQDPRFGQTGNYADYKGPQVGPSATSQIPDILTGNMGPYVGPEKTLPTVENVSSTAEQMYNGFNRFMDSKGVQTFGKIGAAAVNIARPLNRMLQAREEDARREDLKNAYLADNAFNTIGADLSGSQGDYDLNTGYLRPNDKVISRQGKYGLEIKDLGSDVVDIDDDLFAELKAAGVDIRLL